MRLCLNWCFYPQCTHTPIAQNPATLPYMQYNPSPFKKTFTLPLRSPVTLYNMRAPAEKPVTRRRLAMELGPPSGLLGCGSCCTRMTQEAIVCVCDWRGSAGVCSAEQGSHASLAVRKSAQAGWLSACLRRAVNPPKPAPTHVDRQQCTHRSSPRRLHTHTHARAHTSRGTPTPRRTRSECVHLTCG